MDIRKISPTYAVSPQIGPDDVQAIADAGFKTIICNRPDMENPPSLSASVIEAAARDAGLDFVVNPVTHQGLNMDMVDLQKATVDQSQGPTLAYCASGTRSSIVWALGHAKELTADEIIAATAGAGYDLGGLRPQLAALASDGAA